jgi:hypothetical protein
LGWHGNQDMAFGSQDMGQRTSLDRRDTIMSHDRKQNGMKERVRLGSTPDAQRETAGSGNSVQHDGTIIKLLKAQLRHAINMVDIL